MFEETDPMVGVILGRDIDWQRDAACAGTDVEIFFPEKGVSVKDAKRLCSRCLVRAECLEFALDLRERFGVWGGRTEHERRRLLKLLGQEGTAA